MPPEKRYIVMRVAVNNSESDCTPLFECVNVIAFKRENESHYTTAKVIKALEGFIIEAANGYELLLFGLLEFADHSL